MEIWMDRIDPHGMGGIGPYTMPLHSPPLQDHGHSESKGPQWVEYGDLGSLWRRGRGSWLQNMSGVRHGFGGGHLGQGFLPCQHLSLSVHRLHNTSASLSTSAIPPLPPCSVFSLPLLFLGSLGTHWLVLGRRAGPLLGQILGL